MRLEDELKVMLIEKLKVEEVQPGDLSDDAPLFGGGLGLDSLDAVELVLLLKKDYQVEIKDMDAARQPFTSIKTLAEYVRTHRDES